MDDKKLDEKIIETKEEKKNSESLNIKAIKKMNEYYENLYNELKEKNNPEDKEKIEAIKEELDKNKELLNKLKTTKKDKQETIKEEDKIQELEKKEAEEDIETEEKIPEKITVILDCERGEYLFKKENSIDLKAYEIRTKLLEDKDIRRQYIEDLKGKFGDFPSDFVDITLCKALEENYSEGESKELIRRYIEAINEKEKLPIELVYNFNGLKDLKREGFLSKSAINKLMLVSNFCIENNLANVQKEETGIKKVISSVKRFFSKREFHGNINILPEGEKSRKIKIEFIDGMYFLSCGKSKGKEYGDIYIYDARCKINDEDELEKIEQLYDLNLSNKEITRIDLSIYRLLKDFEKLNIRVEDRDLNNLAESYLHSIISKEVRPDVKNLLEIIYDIGNLEDVNEKILSYDDEKQIKKKAKFAEKIGLAVIEYTEDYIGPDEKLIQEFENENYFCKIADENDLDDKNKLAFEKLKDKIKEKSEELGETKEEKIIEEIAKEKGIELKTSSNLKKGTEQLKIEIIEKIIKGK